MARNQKHTKSAHPEKNGTNIVSYILRFSFHALPYLRSFAQLIIITISKSFNLIGEFIRLLFPHFANLITELIRALALIISTSITALASVISNVFPVLIKYVFSVLLLIVVLRGTPLPASLELLFGSEYSTAVSLIPTLLAPVQTLVASVPTPTPTPTLPVESQRIRIEAIFPSDLPVIPPTPQVTLILSDIQTDVNHATPSPRIPEGPMVIRTLVSYLHPELQYFSQDYSTD